MYLLCFFANAVIAVSHRLWQNKADYERFACTHACCLKSTFFLTLTLTEGGRSRPDSRPVWAQCQAPVLEWKGWPALPRPFFSLSGCLSGRQEAVTEQGEKWTYVPSFTESEIVSGLSPAERRRLSHKRTQTSENNKMHPVQGLTSAFVPLCF